MNVWPDPNSDRVFSLQVGAYASADRAWFVREQLNSAGFEASLEAYREYTRVTVGIQARDVQFAVQRLYVLGFTHIWIRE
jgi:cell division protein FtsN